MKKVVFVVSHYGSGSDDLVKVLNRNPRVLIQNQGAEYDHPSSLDWLFQFDHKIDNAAAIYGDHLRVNTSFTCKALYNFCQFVYMIRPAKASLNAIVNWGYTPENAARHYMFRLRRICEMAKQTPGAVLLTLDDMQKEKTFLILEEYLNLNVPLTRLDTEFQEAAKDELDWEVVDTAQESYERHLFYLNQLDLRRVD
jgi:hypothetical protein